MSSNLGFGKVSLVGAGPGAPKLLTLRGLELLQEADIVLYDGLVNPEALQWASPAAEILCVGKHGHGGIWSQQEINDRTVAYAKSGKSVVRLKGGDTSIFARTAEEVERLTTESIPYEIVPGITAASAANAYAGIPLTHRDWASAVAFVTGQLQPSDGVSDADEGMDWNSLAKFPGTLVLYMGVTTAGHWSQQLIAGGKSPHTPVALVRRASWNDQKVLRCELGNVAQTIRDAQGFRPPVISIIGEVASLPHAMNWFVNSPLFGKRYLVAASEATGIRLRGLLSSLGASVTLQPALQTHRVKDWSAIDPILHRISDFQWLVFSSPMAVESFFERFFQLGYDARALGSLKIASVGTPTSASLASYHLVADRTPQSPGIENLVPLLSPEAKGNRFLFIRPPEGRTIGQELLEQQGAVCEAIHPYEQTPVSTWPDATLTACKANQFDGIMVTSLNVAERAVEIISPHHTSQRWYSISPRVSDRLRELGCSSIVTAKHADAISMVESIQATELL